MLDRRAESGSDPPRDIGSQLDLERAMGRIDDRYREAFLLVFLQGFTCREAAEILEVPIGTVLSRIHRARQVLRKQLTATPADADRFTSPPSLEVLRREENHG
jgi:RNA polymerase sigma-70 factor (ECF subfamily)